MGLREDRAIREVALADLGKYYDYHRMPEPDIAKHAKKKDDTLRNSMWLWYLTSVEMYKEGVHYQRTW